MGLACRVNSRGDQHSAPSLAASPHPLDGTASTHLTRLVRDAARAAGVGADRLAAVTGTDDIALASELNRIPLSSLLRLWELLTRTATGPGAGLAVAAAAPLGTLTTWDYLVINGRTLVDPSARPSRITAWSPRPPNAST